MLRAATTSNDNESQSYVTVLATKGGRLEKAGQVGGLGRGERIYAVRFIGDRGYVVTFRETDPLYTLDLADPARPRVTGELKILGYSAYLHPVGEHELLGVGQDATPEGMRLGTQVSLFDVSNPPRRGCCSRPASVSRRPRTSSSTTTRSCGGRPSASRSCRSPTRAAALRRRSPSG